MERTTEEPAAGIVCTVYTVVTTVHFFHNSSINKNMFNSIYTMRNTICWIENQFENNIKYQIVYWFKSRCKYTILFNYREKLEKI